MRISGHASLALIGIIATVAGVLYSTPAAARGDFQIPGHGTLRLAVPTGWKVDSQPIGDPAAVAIHIVPESGNGFDIQVTSVWLDADRLSKTSSQLIKDSTQQAANSLLSHSVETAATIQEMRGTESVGSSFALTDRDPGPGEFKYLTQGIFLTGEALSSFTILYRAPKPQEVTDALRMFTEAKYVK